MNANQIKIIEILKEEPRRNVYQIGYPPEFQGLYTFSYPKNIPRFYLTMQEVREMVEKGVLVNEYDDPKMDMKTLVLPGSSRQVPILEVDRNRKQISIQTTNMASAVRTITKHIEPARVRELIRLLQEKTPGTQG